MTLDTLVMPRHSTSHLTCHASHKYGSVIGLAHGHLKPPYLENLEALLRLEPI